MNALKMHTRIFQGCLLAVFLVTATGAAAERTSAEVAIKGYDAVAYFTAGKAMKGSDAFTFSWHGMAWWFMTKENRDLFATDPGNYAPQYDGYCAWAMTESRLAITDPEVWTIVNGKLYLNCSRAAYEKWARDLPGNIRKADENWKQFPGTKERSIGPLAPRSGGE